MQHVCGQILVIITHRPHLYLQGQCNFLPCVHREGRWRNPVKKGHADYLLAIRHVRVCVCVWLLYWKRGWSSLEISVGTSTRWHKQDTSTTSHRLLHSWSPINC